MESRDIGLRLSRLERANRTLTLGLGLFIILAVAGWAVGGQAISDVVKTRELQVLSKDGKVVISARATKNGADVTLNDADGIAQSFWRTAPRLTLFCMTGAGKDPTSTVTISADDFGDTDSHISLFSKKSAQVRLEARGERPAIRAWGAGKQVILLPSAKPAR